MKKWLKWIGGLIVLGLLALQYTDPPPNPPVVPGHDILASNAPPASIVALLKNSCYDCHSFETKWRWYSHIAPVTRLLVSDVKAGRGRLNFSEWPYDEPRRIRKRWRQVAEQVQDGEMPMTSYTWIHRHARLNAEQRDELVKWAKEQSEQ
jgi:hypothetical protein